MHIFHKWSKWIVYNHEGYWMYRNGLFGTPLLETSHKETHIRQQRKCKLCGHVRSRHIRKWGDGNYTIECYKCPSHLEDHGFRTKTKKR